MLSRLLITASVLAFLPVLGAKTAKELTEEHRRNDGVYALLVDHNPAESASWLQRAVATGRTAESILQRLIFWMEQSEVDEGKKRGRLAEAAARVEFELFHDEPALEGATMRVLDTRADYDIDSEDLAYLLALHAGRHTGSKEFHRELFSKLNGDAQATGVLERTLWKRFGQDYLKEGEPEETGPSERGPPDAGNEETGNPRAVSVPKPSSSEESKSGSPSDPQATQVSSEGIPVWIVVLAVVALVVTAFVAGQW
jgi:hypothetical protein